MIIATAVMITGRKSRRSPPSSAASSALAPRDARCSLAKATMRMLFAVATPMLMMAPISDGHAESVVLRDVEHPRDAGERAGQCE